MHNNWVNQTAGSSVARRLIQWPPLVTLGVRQQRHRLVLEVAASYHATRDSG